jgi:hypothetical protein
MQALRAVLVLLLLAATAAFGDQIHDGSWRTAGSMNVPRAHHRTVPISPTRALAVGGSLTGNVFGDSTSSCEIFDLDTMAWRVTAPIGADGVEYPTVLAWTTTLSSGEVLVAGGLAPDGTMLTGSYIFTPKTEKWRRTGDLPEASATENKGVDPLTLRDGRILIAGGFGYADPVDGQLRMSDRTMLFDPRTETWSSAGKLNHGREKGRMTVLRDGRVLIAGGFELIDFNAYGVFEPLREVEIFDPATGAWTELAGEQQKLPLIPFEDSQSAIGALEWWGDGPPVGTGGNGDRGGRVSPGLETLPDGRVLISGGSVDVVDADGFYTATFDRSSSLIFDPGQPSAPWSFPQSQASGLNMSIGRSDFATAAVSGVPYAFGAGNNQLGLWLFSTEAFNPYTSRWETVAPAPESTAFPGNAQVVAFGQEVVRLGKNVVLSGSAWDIDQQTAPSARTYVYRAP